MEFSFNKISLWAEQLVDTVATHRKQALLGLAGLVVGALMLVGYHFYSNWAQAAAHKDFVVALRYFDAPVTTQNVVTDDVVEFATDEDKWKKVEEVFKAGYQKHRGSGLASMFCAYQAEALTRLGNIDGAIEVLQNAIKIMPSNEMREFYKLKLALVKCDSADARVQQDGFADLKKLAEDQKSLANEAGLYYIGAYFWNQRDYAQAKNYWQQYMVKYGLKDAKFQSGFSEVVKSKLKLISADW